MRLVDDIVIQFIRIPKLYMGFPVKCDFNKTLFTHALVQQVMLI